MKKALVLGVMAIVAINLMTVQTVNAQERGTSKPNKATVNARPTTIKLDNTTSTVTTTTTSTTAEGKKNNSNVATANQGNVNQATHDTEEINNFYK